jgi:hypothetical protein
MSSPATSSFSPLETIRAISRRDDNLVTDLVVSKRSLDGFLRLDLSVEFARALETGADFVHVLVDRAGETEVLK